MDLPRKKTRILSTIRVATLQRLAQRLEKIEARRRRKKRPLDAKGEPAESQILPTGIEPLDGLLHQRGFRAGTLVEWLDDCGGADQLALLAARGILAQRVFSHDSHDSHDGLLVVIDREKTFYPPAAAALGIDLRRLILVRPQGTRSEGSAAGKREALVETLWALEQSLQSHGVAIVLCRLDRLSPRAFRRLQLAAERGGGLGFLLRSSLARGEPSWSDVRLGVFSASRSDWNSHSSPVPEEIASSRRRWRLEVLRCRQGAAGQRSILLEHDDAANSLRFFTESLSGSSGVPENGADSNPNGFNRAGGAGPKRAAGA